MCASRMETPADPASRGINRDKRHQHDLWWNGPEWLITGEIPKSLSIVETSGELKKSTLSTGITSLHASVAHRIPKKMLLICRGLTPYAKYSEFLLTLDVLLTK